MGDDAGVIVAVFVGIGAVILPVIMLFDPSHPYHRNAVYSLLLTICLLAGVKLLSYFSHRKIEAGMSGVLVLAIMAVMLVVGVLWIYETIVVYTHFSHSCADLYTNIPKSCN